MMDSLLYAYAPTVVAFGLSGALLLLQLLLADVVGVLSKHTPGNPVEPDHCRLLS